MTRSRDFWPSGTVYGVLLNFRAELHQLGDQVTMPPYKAAPMAPVLYVKTGNTWSANGDDIPVDPQYPRIEVGASIAMVIGPSPAPGVVARHLDRVAAYVLVNDLSVPRASVFRPPVRFKCQDGFLGITSHTVPATGARRRHDRDQLARPADLGRPVQHLARIRRGPMKHARIAWAGAVHDAVEADGRLRLASGRMLELDAVVWLPPLAPVPRPRTILALGLNYADHARELAFKAPDEPLVFVKGENALIGHQAFTTRPAAATSRNPAIPAT